MKVALLAAGVGARLDPGPEAPPKALLRFAGESLLKRTLDILVSFGLGDVTVVVGHRAEEIERELAALGAADLVRTRFNPDYRTSSLLSLWALREVLRAGEPVLYMDADVLYDWRMLERLLGSPHDDCILIDRDIDPDDEWLDVRVRGGQIVAFDKGVMLDDYDIRAEWVGFARFSAGVAARLAEAVEGYVESRPGGRELRGADARRHPGDARLRAGGCDGAAVDRDRFPGRSVPRPSRGPATPGGPPARVGLTNRTSTGGWQARGRHYPAPRTSEIGGSVGAQIEGLARRRADQGRGHVPVLSGRAGGDRRVH